MRPRFSIPTRIFLAFALTLVAFGAIALTSVIQHERTSRQLRLLHDGYLPLALRLGEARSHQNVYRRHVERLLESPTELRWFNAARQLRPSTMRRLRHFVDRAEELATKAGDRSTLPPIRDALDEVAGAYESTAPRYEALVDTLEAGDPARAAALHEELQASELEIERQYREAYNHIVDRIDSLAAAASTRERRAALLLGVFAILALLLGLSATLWSQRMLKPLPTLQRRVAAVAEGDLAAQPLTVKGDDELARLAQDFEQMVEALAARDARLRDLRRMQAQIVAGLRAAVVVVDADDVVRTVNPAAAEVLGLDEDSIGHGLGALGLRGALPELGEALDAVREDARARTLEAEPWRRPGEEGERRVDFLVTPFGSEPGALLLVADDVTEAVRTKARLIQTERLAAIGRMAAHVTHEVRNPLSSIGLNVEMLGDEIPAGESEARALLAAIQKEIDRLTGITEEYLRLARLPQPRLEADDLGDLARTVADFVRPEMRAAGVELEVEIDEALPLVAFDEAQLRQSLLNLLRNAREAVEGAERDGVALRVLAEDGGVSLRVEDEGPGIPAAMRHRVFDLFFTTKERGSGLGLPLTQQIVAAHGGRIRCTPREGGPGTVFALWFPAADAFDEAPAREEEPARRGDGPPAELAPAPADGMTGT
ncbi:MAG TPA: ATP-binding protein [Polyangiaceae bacterium LLY-WYZ-15_(1-7)]|nr:ATP-binding protein [Polyangiaceae bacterium LLY-WYZ-15_(1-7)]